MKKKMISVTAMATLAASSLAQEASKAKIYIEPKVNQVAKAHFNAYGGCRANQGEVDYSLKATGALMDKCPGIITVTTDSASSDFTLRCRMRSVPGQSTCQQ